MHQLLILTTFAAAGCWGIVAVFSLLFQCSAPNFWQVLGNECVDRVALFTVIETLNALLDIVLITLPAIITWGLQIRLARRVVLVSTFLTRFAFVSPLSSRLT
jgi:hypothetical protein